MKAEGLNWAEAIRAYGADKRVRDRMGTEFWLNGDTPMKDHGDGDGPYPDEVYLGIDQTYGPFSIVLPETLPAGTCVKLEDKAPFFETLPEEKGLTASGIAANLAFIYIEATSPCAKRQVQLNNNVQFWGTIDALERWGWTFKEVKP